MKQRGRREASAWAMQRKRTENGPMLGEATVGPEIELEMGKQMGLGPNKKKQKYKDKIK